MGDHRTVASMVLRTLLLLCILVSCTTWAAAPDTASLDKAFAAAKAAYVARDWSKAEQIADAALRASWPGWPPPDASQPDVVKKLKSKPKVFFNLVRVAADSKSRRFVSTSEIVSPEETALLKEEIKLDTDALVAGTGNEESGQGSWTRVQTHEEQALKEEYSLSLSMALSYWTWESRPQFSHFQASRGLIYTPCLGLALNYTNAFFDWSGGGCGGLGRGDLQFSDGHIDNHGTVTLLNGFASGLVQLSDTGSAAFGLEGDFLDLTLTGKISDGTKVAVSNQQVALMAVGRFRVSRLDIKFKGGAIIDNPSAVWQLELAYPLWR
jgi:hypothetical protein